MPIIQAPNRMDIGIVRDIEPYRLPAGVWSDGLNMLFQRQKAQKAFGSQSFITSSTISPRELFFCPLNQTGFWIYPGLTAIYAYNIDGTMADISRTVGGAYTGTEDNLWSFCYLNGIAILSNNADLPQYWSPSLSNDCAALTNWPAATYAKVIRSFKNFLIALDVTKAAGRYGQLVKWSHPADPNALPSSWDHTDATKLAGEFPLTKSVGSVMDCLPLGNSNVVYKEDAVWAMNFVGGQSIFGFNPMFESFGILAQNCAAALPGQHIVATRDDLIAHNGVQAKSILNERDKKWLFDHITISSYVRCRLVYWSTRGEVWFFFGFDGSSVPNMALIWNESSGAVTFREIPSSRGFAYSYPLILSAADTWDGDTTQQWGSETTQIWDEASFVEVRQRFFFVRSDLDQIHEFKETLYQDNAVNYRSYLERQDLPFIAMDDRGGTVMDLDTVKFIKEIYPRISGTPGTQILIYYGFKMDPTETISWQGPVTYTLGTDVLVGIYQSGRLFSIRFEATDSVNWEVHGFAYDLEPLGRF